MFSTIETWLFKNAAAKALKLLLDKLPANGGKSILGVLLLVLGAVAQAVPGAPYVTYLNVLIGIIQQLGPDVVQDAGLVTLIVGVVHKALKIFGVNDDAPATPVVVSIK